MTEYVRVRTKGAGHEITIRADRFDGKTAERLDKDPLGRDGLPLPPKYKTTVKKAAEKKATPSGQQADTRKDKD